MATASVAHTTARPKRKTGRCSGCGARRPYRELIEVTEENSAFTLSVFVGERYCHSCARRHGIL